MEACSEQLAKKIRRRQSSQNEGAELSRASRRPRRCLFQQCHANAPPKRCRQRGSVWLHPSWDCSREKKRLGRAISSRAVSGPDAGLIVIHQREMPYQENSLPSHLPTRLSRRRNQKALVGSLFQARRPSEKRSDWRDEPTVGSRSRASGNLGPWTRLTRAGDGVR